MRKFLRQSLTARIIALLIVLAIVTGGWRIVMELSQPTTVAVGSASDTSSQSSYRVDLTPKLTSGQHVSFNRPKDLKLISTALVSVPSVEDFTFYVKDTASWTLAVDISRTPTGNLSESSSYTLRKNNPATYSASTITAQGQTVQIMTDTSVASGFSNVAYLTHGTFVATISLIGNDNSGTGPLDATFAMVLNSWHWL